MVKDNITGTPNKDIDKIGRLLTLGLDISVGRGASMPIKGKERFFNKHTERFEIKENKSC